MTARRNPYVRPLAVADQVTIDMSIGDYHDLVADLAAWAKTSHLAGLHADAEKVESLMGRISASVVYYPRPNRAGA